MKSLNAFIYLQPIDPTLYPEFFLSVVSNPSSSLIPIATPFVLSITSDISNWIFGKSADDFWDSLYDPKLRLLLLILGVIVKLCMGWVAKQNRPRIPR